MPDEHIDTLLSSRERTQRFTGIKLARLLGTDEHETIAQELANDDEEDVYVRLEAVIALADAGTQGAVTLLASILSSTDSPYFLKSAAAWSLGQIGSERANDELVSAFANVGDGLRYEALENLVGVGGAASESLLQGLQNTDENVVAGCAEALRQLDSLPQGVVDNLLGNIRSGEPNKWVVWLVGHLPREHVNTAIAELQQDSPELHYAVTLIWSFLDSWISKHWELNPTARFPAD